MNLGISFFITSIMLGAGLAMDAFSVSLANGLNEPTMKKSRMCGVATSIDALSVGFTISDYNWMEALFTCLLIGMVTFFICYAGLGIGKKAGTKLAGKAGILGGVILILIGLEIFITGIL